MHILVPIKRVVDSSIKVRVKSDGSGVDTSGAKMSMNPFDEVALEQAIRLREQGLADKVTAVSCGPAGVSQDVLRMALALGADAAILIDAGAATGSLDCLDLAQALKTVVEREHIGLVLCGNQAIDDDLGALGPMLAALLDWPQAAFVSGLALSGGELQVSCEADRGLERLALSAPAVLGVDLRLCDPRPVTLPNMMRARKAAITSLAFGELCPAAGARSAVITVAEPPARQPGLRVNDLAALVEHLRTLPALQPAA